MKTIFTTSKLYSAVILYARFTVIAFSELLIKISKPVPEDLHNMYVLNNDSDIWKNPGIQQY